MSSIEICGAVAAKNGKAHANLKGIRLFGNGAMASDAINILHVNDALPTDLDCYVSSESFMSSWKAFKKPEYELKDNMLVVKQGRAKASLVLQDANTFGIDPAKKPEGRSVEPEDFLVALHRVKPFLDNKSSKRMPTLYVLEGFIYVTDNIFLVRTPIKTQFNEKGKADKPFTLSYETAELLSKIKDNITEILIGDKTISFIFENCWIEAAKYHKELPGAFNEIFDEMGKHKLEALPPEILEDLIYISNQGGPDDMITCGSSGISLIQSGKVSWHIEHKMPIFKTRAKTMHAILTQTDKYSFTDPNKIFFEGTDIQGAWSNLGVSKVDDDSEDGEE